MFHIFHMYISYIIIYIYIYTYSVIFSINYSVFLRLFLFCECVVAFGVLVLHSCSQRTALSRKGSARKGSPRPWAAAQGVSGWPRGHAQTR